MNPRTTATEPLQAAVYARVSTPEQAEIGESVEAPLEDVKVEWVAPNGAPGINAVQIQTPTGLVRL